MPTTYRKKLIEVALPLEDINREAAREKSIRHGHPSTLHMWWARRPLAAARAVLFGQLVDDPSAWPELWKTDEAQDQERERLFEIIRELVKWQNSNDDKTIYAARFEIARSHARAAATSKAKAVLGLAAEGQGFEGGEENGRRLVDEYLATDLPPVHDPFAGGGTIPLEAQRLGLRAIASDLNPVAVLINKALIEIPPRFAGQPPVNPESRRGAGLRTWKGAQGLAEDVRYYGKWMRDEAWKRIGHLYPQVDLPSERGGGKATVIAWLWARTVASPSPAFAGIHVPLVSSFWLSTKEGKETWIEPVVVGKSYHFEIRTGQTNDMAAIDAGTKLGRGANFKCILSGGPIEPDYIKAEGKAKRMGTRMIAIVAEGKGRRLYLPPTEAMEQVAAAAKSEWVPEGDLPNDPRNFWTVNYGLTNYADLFTSRQLVALTTFSDLVAETQELVKQDLLRTLPSSLFSSDAAGTASLRGYEEAIATYLGLGVARYSNASTTICTWNPGQKKEDIRFTFSRQALPMTWDFAEGNPYSASSGNFADNFDTWLFKAISLLATSKTEGVAQQMDAAIPGGASLEIISTDPPYYDNIAYADLSDFFYVWLRRTLQKIYPAETRTLLVPKDAELVATPYRHGSSEKAEAFFLEGMTLALAELARRSVPDVPTTIYYAFKQSEQSDAAGTDALPGISSTGWETFLDAVSRAGFGIVGTWPVRTERAGRSIEIGTNALASSVVLVCRKRPANAPTAIRAEFRRLLRAELPAALKALQHGHIAPVDLAQACIGPGMAVFSRHAKVLEADGTAMSVRTALQLINEALDEYLSAQEGESDGDTRFAVTWFEARGFDPGPYGEAETLAKARNVSVAALAEDGMLKSAAGKVRLCKRDELRDEWDPRRDTRLTVWESVQHMIKRMESAGEPAAAALLHALGSTADKARDLAYRLYSICERKGWAEEARAYNGLVIAWPELQKLTAGLVPPTPIDPAQAELFGHVPNSAGKKSKRTGKRR